MPYAYSFEFLITNRIINFFSQDTSMTIQYNSFLIEQILKFAVCMHKMIQKWDENTFYRECCKREKNLKIKALHDVISFIT